jgi:hypothetical protein
MAALKPIGISNPNTVVEKAKGLIFPASPIQSEIPLYLSFTCVEYSQTALTRSTGNLSGAIGGIANTAGASGVKARILVPYPTKFTTQTAMRYKNEENENIMPAGNKAIDKTAKAIDDALTAASGGVGVGAVAGSVTKEIFNLIKGLGTATNLSSQIDSDFTETILQSGSKRSFQVQLYLPCLNTEDSIAAAKIATAFESLALPTTFGENLAVSGFANKLGVQLFFHPPMWFLGVTTLGSIKNLNVWSSQPQASVLTNVAVNRSAIDSPALNALNDGNPFAYSITLNFQEIEAAVRVPGGKDKETSFTIANRSAFNSQIATQEQVEKTVEATSG